MSRPPKYQADEALEAALAAGPRSGGAHSPAHGDETWTDLSNDLREALRPGPGGLHDHQRQRILDAAMALTEPALAPARPVIDLPVPRREPVLWAPIAAAACFALLLLAGARWLPFARDWNRSTNEVAESGYSFNPMRMIPAGLATSMFPASTRQPSAPSIALAMEKGFLPSSRGHVAELVPNPGWNGFERVRSVMRHDGCLPAAGSVAIEEMLNYFPYGLPDPQPGQPVSLAAENGPCPWEPTHRLVRVSMRAWGEARHRGPVARDVRIVMDFNPTKISAFRLIGYQGGNLPARLAEIQGVDLSAGQGATALYEVIPISAAGSWRGEGWQEAVSSSSGPGSYLLAARVVYRQPGRSDQCEAKVVVPESDPWMGEVSSDFRFTAAVAACGLLLNRSIEGYRFEDVLELASSSLDHDPDGRRAEFVGLVKQASKIAEPR